MVKKILTWVLAIFLALAAMIYQRSTGPTYEYKGYLEHQEDSRKYKLLRSQETTEGAKIELPYFEGINYTATLHYKRYQTQDDITDLDFQLDENKLFIAQLPVQPAAGKIEYSITGSIDGKEFSIPEKGEDNIVLRYKDPVPDYILIPHVTMMIIVIIFGIRAGLGAAFNDGTMRRWTIVAFTAMTVGGMMLGPIVQKYAFGEYWTGFPNGSDFTDNKMLIMWIAWALALAIIGFKPKKKEGVSRATVLMASVVMTMVYLIPHSMGGSTLDYDAVDKGIDPKEAIKTGAEH
ncbi:MAG: hypothetical protein N4A35_17435 [Flavobacteriales bacterium]|jgi:hypothetical protein|nr:hypothetical protein [Flavobacteriales bacterium]